MMLFLVLGTALTGLAIAFVLPASWRSRAPPAAAGPDAHLVALRVQLSRLDQERAAHLLSAEEYAAARADIEARALEFAAGHPPFLRQPTAHPHRPRTGLALSLGIPLFALALYAALGQPGAVSGSGAAPAPVAAADVEAMVAQLERGLQASPSGAPADPAGWELLARTYASLLRFDDAARAYGRAAALQPDQAGPLADQADALAMSPSPSARAEADALIGRALALDPGHVKALALAGGAAFERRDYPAAIVYWTQARARAPADSAFAIGLDNSLAAAREALPLTPSTVAKATPGRVMASPGANAALTLQGELRLSPALASRAAPGDVVFVYARAAEGGRIPLAIRRYQVSELPLRFALDDSMAMSPDHRLSAAGPVIVTARVSRSGDARPQAGDLWAESAAVRPGGRALALTIDQVQP